MDFQSWKSIHEQQLNEIPEIYWESLFTKLCTDNFDAAEYFIMSPSSSGWRVKVNNSEGIKVTDNSIFLIDHSWTYMPENCHQQLHSVPGLAKRMANLMDLIERPCTPPIPLDDSFDTDDPVIAVTNGTSEIVDSSSSSNNTDGDNEEEEEEIETVATSDETPPTPPSEELVLLVMENMWRFNDCYSIFNVPVPVWYILEEFGSRIPHSTNPSIGIKPFFHILTQMSHSVFWPLRDLYYGDDLTRDRIPPFARTELEKACYSIPWSPPTHLSLTDSIWTECDSIPPPPMPEKYNESLPNELPFVMPLPTLPYKVFTNVDLVKKTLKHPHFVMVNTVEEANVMWMYDHFRDYDSLAPDCYINQFPGENIVTCKDLLAAVSKNIADGDTPKWLPETYNLFYELPRFVHRYKTLEANESDNTWIIKPWNLGRGMDMYVTQNLNQVIRLVNTVPKVACKYLSNPVLFNREDIGGMVKMDIRYVVLLVSVKPLILYAYNTFWLRFANKPYSLDSFHDYQKHFTVMNYQEEDVLKHIESADFIPMFNNQYPMYPWESVENDIFKALWEVFKAASMKPYPAGFGDFLQSRAMYAVDMMLDWSEPEEGCDCRTMQPKILEVNFCADTIRACKHHEQFYNHVFECLFLPESLHNNDLPVTKLQF